LKKLIASADVLIDPFRPGVMERLGLGPEVFLGDNRQKGLNERLVYARIVGFSRTGPHKDMAGHDINYLALSGVLSLFPGPPEKPSFPLNSLADFAGGGLTCALGILLALITRAKSGCGQVVSTDMVSGTRYVSSFPILHSLDPSSLILGGDRGTNILDGGAPFYNVYTCKDGRWMSVGCLEPAFFKVFIEKFLEALPKAFALQDGWMPTDNVQMDTGEWPKLKELLEKGFMTNTRDYWEGVFHGTDACAVPVLTPTEAAALDLSPSKFPAPHPKVAGTGNSVNLGLTSLNLRPGQHTEEVLHELGLSNGERNRLALDGALGEDAQSVAWRKPKL